MRTLRFTVNKQNIQPDPNCDFNGLVPGTDGYLQASFLFSSEWDGCTKVVAFRSRTGKEFPPQLLEDGKTCMIPTEALERRMFSVQVIGKKKGFRIITNKTVVSQNGGKR